MSSSGKIERQWKVITDLCDQILSERRLELGREFLKLRDLYVDHGRTSAGGFVGTFEKECEKRGALWHFDLL